MQELIFAETYLRIPREQIVATYAAHAEEVHRQVEAAIEKAITEFNFERAVRANVTPMLNDAVKRAVDWAISDVLEEIDIRGLIKNAIQNLSNKNPVPDAVDNS